MKEAGGGGVIQRRKIKWAICKFSISRILLNQSLREKKNDVIDSFLSIG